MWLGMSFELFAGNFYHIWCYIQTACILPAEVFSVLLYNLVVWQVLGLKGLRRWWTHLEDQLGLKVIHSLIVLHRNPQKKWMCGSPSRRILPFYVCLWHIEILYKVVLYWINPFCIHRLLSRCVYRQPQQWLSCPPLNYDMYNFNFNFFFFIYTQPLL